MSSCQLISLQCTAERQAPVGVPWRFTLPYLHKHASLSGSLMHLQPAAGLNRPGTLSYQISNTSPETLSSGQVLGSVPSGQEGQALGIAEEVVSGIKGVKYAVDSRWVGPV